MATITKRGNFWRAQVRRRGYQPQHKTFDTRVEADAWARGTESESTGHEARLPAVTSSFSVLQKVIFGWARATTARALFSSRTTGRLRLVKKRWLHFRRCRAGK
jgi:hypothetical protein